MASTESIDQLDAFRDNSEYLGTMVALNDETYSDEENGSSKRSLSSLDVRRRIEALREERELRYLIDDIFSGEFNE